MAEEHYHIDKAGSVNPAAQTVNDTYHIYEASRPSRYGSYLRQLHQEIEDKTTRQIIDDLLYYTTKLDGTKGMEEKLKDGGLRDSFIHNALHKKQMYAKKAMQFDCYPSAQEINLLIFADIVNSFQVYIEPMINNETPMEIVMVQIKEKVVDPIMDKINADGAEDQDLHYTSDHIYGMIYYLTGMCHLNWKNYDNV